MRNIFAAIALCAICGLTAQAQDLTIPQPSTQQKIEQGFGLGSITITYSRPNTKGRKIFGYVEPNGLVWRTGANSATKIKLTDTFNIEGHALPPGEYALFTIPSATQWTVIINKTANQWGAYSYDSTQDLLRFKVKATKLDKRVETFTIQFANATVDNCDMQLVWENTLVPIHFSTDVDAKVMDNINKAMKGDKKPYYFASIYYYNHNKDMRTALAWITEADKAQAGAYNIKYWKARIQLKLGDKLGAIATASEGLKEAQAEPSAEYIRMCSEVLAEAKK